MSSSSGPFNPLDAEPEDGFIRQIFNYCDQWCERCPFTLRCRVYAMQEDREKRRQEQDSENQQFWETLSGLSDRPLDFPAHEADEWDDALSDAEGPNKDDEEWDGAEEAQETWDEMHDAARKRGGQCIQSAEAYAWRMNAFMEDHPELAEEGAGEQHAASQPGTVSPAEAKARGVHLAEALEVVLWYEFFIASKVNRSFLSLVDEEGEDREMFKDMPRDSDGSAKVALIAIDRSVAAWTVLRELLPEHGDLALDFMLRLHRLRQSMEAEFPNARAFVRPGFDEV
jgi:hypothetical protein